MKDEDKTKIPTQRVTLSAPDTRNRTVIKVSAQRHDKSPKKPDDRRQTARPREEAQDNRFVKSERFPSAAKPREEAKDFQPKKSDGFSETPDNRFKKSGAIWEAMDNRPKKSDDFRPNVEAVPPAVALVETEREEPLNGEDDFYSRTSDFTASYKKALSDRPETEVPFKSFIVEVLFSALLLVSVCALLTIKINSGGSFLSFFYPGNTLWAYICISIAVFALARMFSSAQYYIAIFVAFGTFFYMNLNWFNNLARLFSGETIAPTIGFAMYYFLLVGLFFTLWQLYKKRIKLHFIVKVLSAALACLVLVNVVIHLPL